MKMIVIACGTASSVISKELGAKIKVPYTGVILPAAQAACSLTQKGVIGVIGTTATIRSGAYGKSIRSINSACKVIGRDCPLFVPLVENGLIEPQNPITRLTAQMYLEPLMQEGIDTLILGCTHYPLLYDLINDVIGYSAVLIDPGKELSLIHISSRKVPELMAMPVGDWVSCRESGSIPRVLAYCARESSSSPIR